MTIKNNSYTIAKTSLIISESIDGIIRHEPAGGTAAFAGHDLACLCIIGLSDTSPGKGFPSSKGLHLCTTNAAVPAD